MKDSELNFSVDSQLLGELGEKLVTKNYIALSELIKNSYDADATEVIVRLINAGTGGSENNQGEIQILDNGTGMSFEEVRDHWMRIGTANKLRDPVSNKFGRQKTGNKGIGRFACQRIAKRLDLQATAKSSKGKLEHTDVMFNWDEFTPGTDLTEIPCKYVSSRSQEGEPGLWLKLMTLRDKWTERDFTMLRRQVLILATPMDVRRKGFQEDPGFNIKLDAPEYPLGKGVLIDQFMNAGWGTLRGRVDSSGKATLHLDAKFIGKREIEFPDFKELKGVHFEISWIPQQKEYLRDTSTLTMGLIQEVLLEQGGVRLYLNGFRVYPYGEPEDDWLGIERDVARRKGTLENTVLKDLARQLRIDPSRALLLYPRHRSLIGKVSISSSDGTSFIIKTDREGLVENKTYLDLVRLLRLSLDWMTLYYTVSKKKYAKERLEAAEADFIKATGSTQDQKQVVNNALKLIIQEATNPEPELKRDKRESLVLQAKEVIEARFEEADAELAVLRAVASTGPLMFVFAHEVKGIIGALDTHAGHLETLIPDVKRERRGEVSELAEAFRQTSSRFAQLSRFFGVFSTAQKLDKKRIPILKAVFQVKEGFGFVLSEFGLKIENDAIDESVKTQLMSEAELYSILVNLISNAVKACIAGDGDEIKVRATRDGNLTIKIFDNGIGLPEKRWEEVFEPLSADPENKIYPELSKKLGDGNLAVLGRGTGLGLSIVKSIVESNGGKVQFVTPRGKWNTCIEVILP